MRGITNLNHADLQWALRRAPIQLLAAMKRMPGSVIVAGGFIRSVIANEEVHDIDVFVSSPALGVALADILTENNRTKQVETQNAITLKCFKPVIQIITRWTYEQPGDVISSFDFTIARSAFWHDGASWVGMCDPDFYRDLAAKRLVYCCPVRNEDAGGSMLRVLKFYQRGYRIPLDSLAAVIARLASGLVLDDSMRHGDKIDESRCAHVVTGLLREVDPDIDPGHIAHLPAENAKDASSLSLDGQIAAAESQTA